ncbi:MAG: NAD-dependent epimerase/dehydratase family protein [Flavobacteriaceae bacterium]|nr:NAD-dependent epimerase/dehydratase family protein [Flavobacteriaceae bacterium]RZW48095.1 MAG: NAD-dependent epimerase/dehydratase family protein [Flavobacteriaceae bacterium]
MILVTGGTGLVGSHLLYKLVKKHDFVRATFRRQHKIKAVRHVFSYYSEEAETLFKKIEWVEANLNDIPKLTLAFKDITQVYHCAAMVSFDPNDYHQLRQINITGTANIVNLCLSHNITKLCYVSSIAAIGNEDDTSNITESVPWNPEENHSVYAITKYGAEIEVWRGIHEGLNAVIVNPGMIIGPGFWRSSSGVLIRTIHKGLKYFTTGITGYVDIFDVVDCMTILMASDIQNERFILISDNLSFKSFVEKVAKHLQVNPPKKEAKHWQLQLAWRMDWLRHLLLRKRRRLTRNTVKSISTKQYYNNSKIKNALNFEFRPIDKSIKETCDHYLNDLKD